MINDPYTFKNVPITFKLKNRFASDSFNLIYVLILGRQGKEKLNKGAESECIANTFGKHNTNNYKLKDI